MTKEKERFLKLKAAEIRLAALEAIYQIKKGHIGGSFSIADVLSVLYFDTMRIDPKHADDPERDRFVMSKGHCSPSGYAVLYLKGFITKEQLMTFRHIDSNLSGHMYMGVPGVEVSTGSLGQGVSVAAGIALAGKSGKHDYKVYCACGDGEIEEGQVWEAAMAAANFKLDNFCIIVDSNKIQLDDRVEHISPSLMPIEEKFRSFGFNVMTIDGNDVASIAGAFDIFKDLHNGKPTCIVANTIKGKGATEFEDKVKYHGAMPDEAGFQSAFGELHARIDALKKEAE